jgi:hypothetical protein
MIEVRRDADIHAEDGGWFHARWHFSFDHYRDPGPETINIHAVSETELILIDVPAQYTPVGVWRR